MNYSCIEGKCKYIQYGYLGTGAILTCTGYESNKCKVETVSEIEAPEKQNRKNKYLSLNAQSKITLIDLDSIGYFEAPASTKYHGAYDGGLFDHSYAVADHLMDLTKKLSLKWEREESPYIVGLYHDLCKCDSYIKNSETGAWEYNNDILIPGHGDKSVIIAQKFIKLTDEEIACIRWHMGAFEDDPKLRNGYSKACQKYPNVLFTHTADMMASAIDKI